MGKTTCWESTLEVARDTLCPDCDRLGPLTVGNPTDAGDYWIDCMDCGASLGHWTPNGIQTLSKPAPWEQTLAEPCTPQRLGFYGCCPGSQVWRK